MAFSRLLARGPTSISVAVVTGDSSEIMDADHDCETRQERRGLGHLATWATHLAVLGLARVLALVCSLYSTVWDHRSCLKAANSCSHSSTAWALRASSHAVYNRVTSLWTQALVSAMRQALRLLANQLDHSIR